jgi:surface protein
MQARSRVGVFLVGFLMLGAVAFGMAQTAQAATPNDFIITVKTDNPGSSPANAFTIPTNGAGYSYDVDCDTSDTADALLVGQTGDATCIYPVAGTYSIAVSGTFPHIFFNYVGDVEKLLSVDQWGTNVWTSMAFAFAGAVNMNILASDVPNLSSVTSMSGMFNVASTVNADLSAWDVSNVTDMSGMFSGALAFNGNISTWNTSQVTNMYAMFVAALAFNQDISSWNTANVTNMSYMFKAAPLFNQNISSWNTANVTDMSSMFFQAGAFNQNISTWNTVQVTDMSRMFEEAAAFNQNLGAWNVGSVVNASSFLKDSGISIFNYDQTLVGWSAQTVQPNVAFGAGTTQYCTAAAHDALTLPANNWIITDGGQSPICASSLISVEFSATSSVSVNETSINNFPRLLARGLFSAPATIEFVITGGTAVNGADFSMSMPAVITIPAGLYDGTSSTAIMLPVPTLIDDSVVDGNRTMVFGLTNPSGTLQVGDADGSKTIEDVFTYTITDDDVVTDCQNTGCGSGSTGTAIPQNTQSQGGQDEPGNQGDPGSQGEQPVPTIPVVSGDDAGQVLGERISLIDELIIKYDCYTYADGIKQLQIELQKQGYFPADFVPTRYYGNQTRAAVTKYMADQAPSMTVNELVKFAFKLGQRNDAVKRLQTELQALGYFPKNVAISGYRGPITKAAVAKYKAAQR